MVILGQAWRTAQLLSHLSIGLFIFMFGACVGSFLNVVIYRLPAGMSVISPPSRCPVCGARLKFFTENLPILGWFAVRGKCRYCGVRISPQYMIIELFMALVFVTLYAVLYLPARGSALAAIGGPWWIGNPWMYTFPAFFAIAIMFAGLFAMTMIDARTFTIPIQIPLFVTAVAFAAWAVQPILPLRPTPGQNWPMVVTQNGQSVLCAFLGMVGILISTALLRLGVLKPSFADYYDHVDENETIGEYPHARREMRVELLFLLPCIVLMVAGWFFGRGLASVCPPVWWQVLGGACMGYLAGGGIVWAVRIFGTLGFGREAMGMGDVHLLAAVGAVLGWYDSIIIFFLSPFLALAWVIMSKGMSTVFRWRSRHLPFGPHLALATLVVFFGRPLVNAGLTSILGPAVTLPTPGYCVPEAASPRGTAAAFSVHRP